METDRNLYPAFNVVKQYDPDLFQRMINSKWRVSGHMPMQLLGNGYGVTRSDVNASALDMDYTIPEKAEQDNMSETMFAADVLVHEFQHTKIAGQADNTPPVEAEIPAFKAGSAFAAKLPAPDGPKIKQLSDDTLRHVVSNGGY